MLGTRSRVGRPRRDPRQARLTPSTSVGPVGRGASPAGHDGSVTDVPAWQSYSPSHPRPSGPVDQGQLQAVVQIHVYDGGALPQVSFTPECSLRPDSDPELIAQVVSRAAEALNSWR